MPLDGHSYEDCVFANVTFRWNGGPFLILRGRIIGHRRLETFNPTAVDTVDTLQALGFLEPNFSADWRHLLPVP